MTPPKWFIDAFCGSGKIGNVLHGWNQLVYFLDNVLGPKGDLCARAMLQLLSRDARMHNIIGAMLAPPRARRIHGFSRSPRRGLCARRNTLVVFLA